MMMRSVAVVNSSISEGLSNTLLEAMYLNVPVIARYNSLSLSLSLSIYLLPPKYTIEITWAMYLLLKTWLLVRLSKNSFLRTEG